MKANILKHPLVIILAVGIGVVIGLYNRDISAFFRIRDFANAIYIPGQIYLFYLQMTVIPIIITAISSSLGRMLRSNTNSGLIKRMCIVFLLGLSLTAVVGILVGFIGKPGADLGAATRRLLTDLISEHGSSGSDALEISLSGSANIIQNNSGGIGSFLVNLIPSNIFQALALGSTMAVVFFSITFGIAIGFINDESAELLINILSSIFEAFQKLVNASLYLLPFGLVCLMAGQIAQVGVLVFMAMSKFIFLYCIGTALLFFITTIFIWVRSGIANPFKVLGMLFEPMLLAFATRNSMATLPSAINCLTNKMQFDKTAVNLTLPLGMTLGRFGNIYYFAVAVFFVAQIYGMTITPSQMGLIFFGVLLAGTATAGASGIVTISVISIALTPLNLPVEAILVILMAIDPIIDPFRTLYLVYGNMAATAMIAGRKKVLVNTLNVVLRKGGKSPLLTHDSNGNLVGYEINLLAEIARRLGKTLNVAEGMLPGDEPIDIIGGCVVKTQQAPRGFVYSTPWAFMNDHKIKLPLCFMLQPMSPESAKIDAIIKSLNSENYLKTSQKNERVNVS
jgi:proton glutamate symport protein